MAAQLMPSAQQRQTNRLQAPGRCLAVLAPEQLCRALCGAAVSCRNLSFHQSKAVCLRGVRHEGPHAVATLEAALCCSLPHLSASLAARRSIPGFPGGLAEGILLQSIVPTFECCLRWRQQFITMPSESQRLGSLIGCLLCSSRCSNACAGVCHDAWGIQALWQLRRALRAATQQPQWWQADDGQLRHPDARSAAHGSCQDAL